MKTIWICCPVYFDVKSFKEIRKRVLSDANKIFEFGIDAIKFVVADDSAGFDPEIQDLLIHDDIQIVAMQVNSGHQKAIVSSLRLIADQIHESDLVVTMDGDGEDNPSDIPRLLNALRESVDTQIVVAKRTSRSENMKFKIMYKFFKIFFMIMTGKKITSGNFAIQTARNVERIIFRASFDLCYSSSLVALNPNLMYVACARSSRFEGQSKMNTYSLISHGIRMLMPFWERISVRLLGLALLTFLSTNFLALFTVIASKVNGLSLAAIQLGYSVSTVLFLGSIIFFAIFARFDEGRK